MASRALVITTSRAHTATARKPRMANGATAPWGRTSTWGRDTGLVRGCTLGRRTGWASRRAPLRVASGAGWGW